MFQELRSSIALVLFLILLTGVAYPLAMTEIGQKLFPYQANGSLIVEEGKVIGSELIGQSFTSNVYFHSRPSAAGSGYDATASGGSNLGPTSPKLLDTIKERVAEYRKDGDVRPIPVDLVTASGSGLDPDISVAAAMYQAPHIADVRHIPVFQIEKLIAKCTTPRTFGVLGEKRVNVLALNRALDLLSAELARTSTPPSPPKAP